MSNGSRPLAPIQRSVPWIRNIRSPNSPANLHASYLSDRFDAALREAGYVAMGGQIVDASLIAAPKQRNTEEEKKAIKEGASLRTWKAEPAKLRHKDRDALDGQVQQGQGEDRRDGSSGRHRHSDIRLPKPCLDRPRTWADPALRRDRRCGLRGRAPA